MVVVIFHQGLGDYEVHFLHIAALTQRKRSLRKPVVSESVGHVSEVKRNTID